MRTGWIMILVVVAAAVASLGAADEKSEASRMFDGAYLFELHCDDCHGDSGQGVSLFGPPLKGDAFVTAGDYESIGYVINNGRKYRDKIYPEYSGMPKFQFITGGKLQALIDHLKGPLQESEKKDKSGS